ncbi:hsp90 co-chaperone Cdc37 [Coemansia sp. RSA 376]|nr:hsp90 co-chaperone Cdc37 [Coemansia sp. RSA 376]KAJ2460750.1 hsp90 co-chaperone Cdc37 [Coemansia sp. RSA 2337]
MPIDYSKWDNLELSDDSDVEAHPNIEKGTFVRLRQRKIREDRENRRIRRERIEATLAMNQGLISRLTTVRDSFQGSDLPKVIEQLDRDIEQARKQKEEGENSQEQPSETDMVNALMARITDDLLQSAANLDTPELKRDAYVVQLTGHLEKLDKVMNDLERELVEVKKEEAKHISPDSIMHTGFDRSFVTPGTANAAAAAGPSNTRTVTTDEVLNPASVGKHKDEDDVDDNGDLKLDDDARTFANLKGMSNSMDYIHKHLAVVSDKKADQILGHAFTLELAGNHALSKQYVRQSLILTYILQMGASGVNVFFSRVGAKGQAQDMFEKDVESRYKHIVGRCEIMRSEGQDDEQQVESIQLQCDDPNAPIRMSVPDGEDEDPERVELFNQLPVDMQDALRVGTLEAVNKVLADVSGPEAERLLGICGQGNFLVIDGEIVVDPNEEPAEEPTTEDST